MILLIVQITDYVQDVFTWDAIFRQRFISSELKYD